MYGWAEGIILKEDYFRKTREPYKQITVTKKMEIKDEFLYLIHHAVKMHGRTD